MNGAWLALNAGSSSLKFALFEAVEGGLRRSAGGEVQGLGRAPRLVAEAGADPAAEPSWAPGAGYEAVLDGVLAWVEARLRGGRLLGAGHRVVHGGPALLDAVLIDDEVVGGLQALAPLAPLHQPHNLAAVAALRAARPALPQVACFDTAFHVGHAPEVYRFGLPREWERRGVRRYGFHGLSYEFVARRMADLAPALAAGRMIVAHLGAGASLCAIRAGRSVDTTMGFTALDGLVMGTRCGALDPGVVLHLETAHGLAAEEVQEMLYTRSGLLGVSEVSDDMRDLLASAAPAAGEAVDLFVYRVVREIGAMSAALGGLDGLVFTAGIGARSPEIRRRVCDRLGWLGIALDSEANRTGAGRISSLDAAASVWAVETDEEQMIAIHTQAVISHARP